MGLNTWVWLGRGLMAPKPKAAPLRYGARVARGERTQRSAFGYTRG